eukprot:364479-Chlamydomonas_euryale.AAC.1
MGRRARLQALAAACRGLGTTVGGDVAVRNFPACVLGRPAVNAIPSRRECHAPSMIRAGRSPGRRQMNSCPSLRERAAVTAATGLTVQRQPCPRLLAAARVLWVRARLQQEGQRRVEPSDQGRGFRALHAPRHDLGGLKPAA